MTTCEHCLGGRHHRCRGCACTSCTIKIRRPPTARQGKRAPRKVLSDPERKAQRNAQDRARRAQRRGGRPSRARVDENEMMGRYMDELRKQRSQEATAC